MSTRSLGFLIGLAISCASSIVDARPSFSASFYFAALSLEQAVRKVRSLEGGRVLGARTDFVGDREVHTIKILSPDGSRVRHFRVDAKSGKVESSGEH